MTDCTYYSSQRARPWVHRQRACLKGVAAPIPGTRRHASTKPLPVKAASTP